MSLTGTALNKTTIPDGPEVASEEIEGVIFQHVKLDFGADGERTPITALTPLPVTFSDEVDVSGSTIEVTASTLPTGAATEATLGSVLTALGDLTTPADTQPISAAALPLPSGAATAALQTQPGVDIGDVTVNNAAGAAAVNIQDGGNSITVDGTVTANAGSGTFAVSAASLPLPSGASTSAKQPALGTAGTPSSDVLTVQGAASMTALLVTPGGNVAHDAADSGNPVKVGGKATSGLPAEVSSGDRADLVTDLHGRLLTAQITPAMQISKPFRYTSAQTGTNLWDPTSGKRIAITHVLLGSGATTAGRLILWFGANGDTTYTAGTDQLILDMTFTPSANATPGAVIALPVPIFCTTADYEVHVTTDAGLTIGGVVYGYEW